MDLGQRGGADGLARELGEVVPERGAGVLEEHALDRLEGGDGAFVLEGDEGRCPLGREEIVHCALLTVIC